MSYRRIGIFVASSLLLAAVTAFAHADDRKIAVMVFRGVQNLPLLAAQAQGFFAKRGLAVDMKIAPSAAELPLGLADGRWQIIHSAADNAVGIATVNKLDVALVIGGDNAFNHLIVQPDIASPADLRGKTIVLDTANSGYAYLLYAILKKNGLNRGDYDIKTVGATPNRLAAMLQDRNVKAAVLNEPFALQAVRGGLRDLGTTVSMMGPYQGTAGYALRSWASANREMLTRYLQAYIEGLRWALDPANKEAATKMLGEALKVSPDLAAASYDIVTDAREGFAKDGRFDIEGFANVLRLRTEYEGGPPPAPERYLDLSYYRGALERR